MDYKTCTRCGKELPKTEEYFYKMKVVTKTKGIYYTLTSRCRECTKYKANEYVDKNRDEVYKRAKPYQESNSDIRNKRAREWHITNKDQDRLNIEKWYEKNPDKQGGYYQQRQHKNHYITQKEWNICKAYFENRCAYCGLPIEEHYFTRKGITKLGDFHKEHVDHEGMNDLSNCIPSCKDCNSHKWEYPFDDWYSKDNPKFSQERLDKINKWLNEDYKRYIEIKPPYRIIKEKENKSYHWNLWSMDDKYNLVRIIATKPKKKDLNTDIQTYKTYLILFEQANKK